MGRKVEGFTLVELVLVITVLLVISVIALNSLVEEKKAYGTVSSLERAKSVLANARFSAVRRLHPCEVEFTSNSIAIVDKTTGDILDNQTVSMPITVYADGKQANSLVFNTLGVAMLPNESIVDNVTLCGVKRCTTIVYAN